MAEKPHQRDFTAEFHFSSSRSSGPGGQNVNKVNTKVTLSFDVGNSELLSDEEKETLRQKLANKINKENFLIIQTDNNRSQLKNKEESVEKFHALLKEAFFIKKKRKPTKPSKAAKEKRLKSKKIQAEKKQARQKF